MEYYSISEQLLREAKPTASQQLLDRVAAAVNSDCVRDIDDAIDKAKNTFVMFPDYMSEQLTLLLTNAKARRDALVFWNHGEPICCAVCILTHFAWQISSLKNAKRSLSTI